MDKRLFSSYRSEVKVPSTSITTGLLILLYACLIQSEVDFFAFAFERVCLPNVDQAPDGLDLPNVESL